MGLGGRSLLLSAAVLAGAAVAGPLRPFMEAALTNHQPQRILVLGGDADRRLSFTPMGDGCALLAILNQFKPWTKVLVWSFVACVENNR